MSSEWIFVTYAVSGALAVGLLYFFGVRRWYLHVISALAALVIGLMPPPASAARNTFYLMTGSLFFLLFVWGAGGRLRP